MTLKQGNQTKWIMVIRSQLWIHATHENRVANFPHDVFPHGRAKCARFGISKGPFFDSNLRVFCYTTTYLSRAYLILCNPNSCYLYEVELSLLGHSTAAS